MYTRGQFAVIGNVGRKALRIYHEEGLLVPAEINEENGYHYYDESQLADLEKIKRLKKLGLSLFEIKQIFDGKANEDEIVASKIKEADEMLKEMKQLAGEEQYKSQNKNDIQIQKQVQNLNGELESHDEPDIASFEIEKCIFVEENVELENLGMSVGKLYERAAHEKMDVVGSHFVRYEGMLKDEEFKMITCLPVSGYSGDDTMEIHEKECLHLKFTGGFSRVSKAHEIIHKYAEKQGIQLTDRVYEVYNKDMSVDVYYSTN